MVPGGSNQLFEQANVRGTYRATGKLTFIGEGGLEFRQYSGGGGAGAGDTVTPVFSLEGAWVPRRHGNRRHTAQADVCVGNPGGPHYTATSVDVTVRQRVTDTVELMLSGGFVNADYSATTTGVDATREDNYFYIRPAISWAPELAVGGIVLRIQRGYVARGRGGRVYPGPRRVADGDPFLRNENETEKNSGVDSGDCVAGRCRAMRRSRMRPIPDSECGRDAPRRVTGWCRRTRSTSVRASGRTTWRPRRGSTRTGTFHSRCSARRRSAGRPCRTRPRWKMLLRNIW